MPSVERVRYAISMFAGVPIGALYGIVVRIIVGQDGFRDLFGVMTIGFIFVMPFVLGVIAVSAAPLPARRSWSYGLMASLVSCVSSLVLMAIFALELVVCLVMLLPASLAMALLGGLLATLVARLLTRPERQSHLAMTLALLPFLVTPIESRFPPADSFRTVRVRQPIHADAATVWYQITHFEPIQPSEHRVSAFHLLGLPNPAQATLMGSGLGVVRRGVYENGLTFREVVTEWEPERTFGFTIGLDPEVPAPAPYDGIGGRYLEMLWARYAIEPAADGTVVLVLESQHRLSTRFNEYSGAWTDFILTDLQGYLLRIVKERAERG
jgi:hypothetical protein